MTTQTPPTEPFIDIPGVLNFRDIGGYLISHSPGKKVRLGMVFRSGELTKITDDGTSSFRKLDIKTIYDLRSLRDRNARGPDPPLGDMKVIEKISAPVFLEEDFSPEAIAIRNQNYGNGPEVIRSLPQSCPLLGYLGANLEIFRDSSKLT